MPHPQIPVCFNFTLYMCLYVWKFSLNEHWCASWCWCSSAHLTHNCRQVLYRALRKWMINYSHKILNGSQRNGRHGHEGKTFEGAAKARWALYFRFGQATEWESHACYQANVEVGFCSILIFLRLASSQYLWSINFWMNFTNLNKFTHHKCAITEGVRITEDASPSFL